MIQPLFSNKVKVAYASPETIEGILFPEENALISSACDKRQQEFSAGRFLARSLLKEFGVTNFPLLKGRKSEPLWPRGFCGSISHLEDLCLAAVAKKEDFESLGLDVVAIEEVFEDLWPSFCTEKELQWLAVQPQPNRQKYAAFIFCAKESLYKCLYPVIKEWIDFKDVSISLTASSADDSFDAVFHIDKGRIISKDQTFTGSYLFEGPHVFTSLTLNASHPFGVGKRADHETHI